VFNRLAGFLGLAAVACLVGQVGLAQERMPPRGFTQPERHKTTPAPAPPVLPAVVANVPAYTMQVSIGPTDGPATARRRRVVSRAPDRVHVAEGRDTEWLFRRNPLDYSRVSAQLTDHRAQTVTTYDESDVRNLLAIEGWAGVVSLGFDHALLAGASPTGERRHVGPVVFSRYATPRSSFWWNQEAGVATDFVQHSPGQALWVVVEQLSAGVDPSVLREPVERVPAYTFLDVAEWLEQPPRRR
jgi:hypothetical protein